MSRHLDAEKEALGELPDTEEFRDFTIQDEKKISPRREVRPRGNSARGVRFIRLQHNGKDWNLNWGLKGDFRMLAEFSKRTNGIPIASRTEFVNVEDLGKFANGCYPLFLYVSGKQPFSVSAKEAIILRKYLHEQGGMILGDSPGGQFSNSFKKMITATLGKDAKWTDIPDDDILFSCYYVLKKGAPPLWRHDGLRMTGIKHNGRWIIVWHPAHMSNAWKVGHSGASRETADKAYDLGVNLIYYSFTRYIDFHRRAEQGSTK